jgi:hypothetical protein
MRSKPGSLSLLLPNDYCSAPRHTYCGSLSGAERLPLVVIVAATARWRNVIVVHALSGEGVAEQEGGRERLDANASHVAGLVLGQQLMNSMDVATNRARTYGAQSAASVDQMMCPT